LVVAISARVSFASARARSSAGVLFEPSFFVIACSDAFARM
jgi:hypothetical protein